MKEKQLTVIIPEELFCKVKAYSAFKNTKLKNLVTEILYLYIQECEDRGFLPKEEYGYCHPSK